MRSLSGEYRRCTAQRQQIASIYTSLLAGCDIGLPQTLARTDPVWHLYVIRSQRRDELQAFLGKHGVSTVIHYPRAPHKQKCYGDFSERSLPIAERLAVTVLSLPMFPELKQQEVSHVAELLHKFYSSE